MSEAQEKDSPNSDPRIAQARKLLKHSIYSLEFAVRQKHRDEANERIEQDIDALILAVQSSPRPIPAEWLPIDMAPKDGTWLIGATFNADGTYAYEPRRMSWGESQHHGPQWCSSTAWFTPTHWMPLPDPPVVTPERRKE